MHMLDFLDHATRQLSGYTTLYAVAGPYRNAILMYWETWMQGDGEMLSNSYIYKMKQAMLLEVYNMQQ